MCANENFDYKLGGNIMSMWPWLEMVQAEFKKKLFILQR